MNDTCQINQMNDACQINQMNDACQINQMDDACQINQMNDAGHIYQMNDACQINQANDTCQINQANDACQIYQMDDASHINQIHPLEIAAIFQRIFSGIYRIKPDKAKAIDVYCEMTIDSGRWTVCDSLDYSNRGRFTTLDRDNDDANDNCARRHPGAWWYKDCMNYNLHGHYYIEAPVGTWNGVILNAWKGHNYSLKATSMMIRDQQRAPLVALVNTSDIRQNILKSFKKQLNEKVDNLVKQKLKNINHRIQKLEEKWKSFEKDISTGSKKRKVIKDCNNLRKDVRSGIYSIKPDKAKACDVYCEMTIDSGRWTVCIISTIHTTPRDVIKPDKFTSHSMTVARDDYWKFLRTKISPTFTTGKLRNMTTLIQRCSDDLVDNIKKQSEGDSVIDMKEIASGFTMDVICSTAFGMQVNSQTEKDNQFVSYARRAMRTQVKAIFFLICMTFPFMKSIMTALFETPQFGGTEHFFKKVVSDILKDRNSSKIHRDFIQIVTEDSSTTDKSEDTEAPQGSSRFHSRALTEDEIAVNSLIFFSAGFDTTSISVSFSSYCLARYPDIQNKLIQEIDNTLGKEIPTHDVVMKMEYLDLFVSEVLRLYAPSTRFTEENKAKRHPYAYLPFGIGPRICVGMRLALLETKMAIVYMLQNFKFVTCDETEIPVIFEKGFLLRAENGIKLKVTQR
ncbi:CYP3A [Mytilus edulis]|uniref:CYP3A n=1 Tax=Mytilus edulis TaxID=6550 RepID=A0A8S3V9C9_MYTED|nr:CYP3A [Mytilus edulis]